MMLWTATSSARDGMDVVLLRPPRFEGRKCKRSRQRSGYSAVSLSGSRRRCGGQYRPPSPAQATLRVGVLAEASVLPGRYRSLRLVASSKWRTNASRTSSCDLVTPRLSAATSAAAPAAWRSSPPSAAPRHASADLVAERCDAAICPELGEKRKCAACA